MAAGHPLRGSLAARLTGSLAFYGDWAPLLQRWRDSAAGRSTLSAVDARIAAGAVVYPADPLAALQLTPCAATRVLILGQDPYHGPGQAEGLAFSVPPDCRVPPSLRNIHAELQRDLGLAPPGHGSLRAWAEQGVLLLNTTLTVEEGRAGSHAALGWQSLTSLICMALLERGRSLVVLLWGAHAQQHWTRACPTERRTVVTLFANHPSPLAARRPPQPFVGCGHFGQANRLLQAAGQPPVRWALPPAA